MVYKICKKKNHNLQNAKFTDIFNSSSILITLQTHEEYSIYSKGVLLLNKIKFCLKTEFLKFINIDYIL